MQVDFLIVGQGLAGSLLAMELIQHGCKVFVVDNGAENASKVSAGIVNPITGTRFAKSVDAEVLLPAALGCYQQLATFFGERFYIDMPMYRIFSDEKELALCKQRLADSAYHPYLGALKQDERNFAEFSTPFGFIEQCQTGHLLKPKLLSRVKQFLIEQHCYRQLDLDYQAFQFDASVHWQDISAKKLIFCEGYLAMQNPWFSWLPLQPVKGEVLTLAHQAQMPEMMLNYGHWWLPISTDKVRIGATFNLSWNNLQPSEQGKQDILAAIRPYTTAIDHAAIVEHQAGIRPCTQDKYPLIGIHPDNNQLAIFNGFGSKGGLQIPFYSKRFADLLLTEQPLPIACNINRFQFV